MPHKRYNRKNNFKEPLNTKKPVPQYSGKLYNLIGSATDEFLLTGLLTRENVNFIGKKTVLMRSIEEKYSQEFLDKVHSLMTKKSLHFFDTENNLSHIDYCLREMKDLDVMDSRYGEYHQFIEILLKDKVVFNMGLLIDLYTQKGTKIYNLFNNHPELETIFHNNIKRSINKNNYKETFINLKNLNFLFDDIVDFIIKSINKESN